MEGRSRRNDMPFALSLPDRMMSHSMLLQERPPVVSGYNGPTQFGSALNVPLLNGAAFILEQRSFCPMLKLDHANFQT
jgi:hypothetical protein